MLDEIVRDGARQMLTAALAAEVAAYVEQFTDLVDEHGRRLVVRNGYGRTPFLGSQTGVMSRGPAARGPPIINVAVIPCRGKRGPSMRGPSTPILFQIKVSTKPGTQSINLFCYLCK